jgi:hypothetical protein
MLHRIGWQRPVRIEELRVVREAACKAAAANQVDAGKEGPISQIAVNALKTVTAERLVRDLHTVVRAGAKFNGWSAAGVLGTYTGVGVGCIFSA